MVIAKSLFATVNANHFSGWFQVFVFDRASNRYMRLCASFSKLLTTLD